MSNFDFNIPFLLQNSELKRQERCVGTFLLEDLNKDNKKIRVNVQYRRGMNSKMYQAIIKIIRVFPYVAALIYFLIQTFPFGGDFEVHIRAGYYSYAMGGCFIIFLTHAGSVWLFKNVPKNKTENRKKLDDEIIARMNPYAALLFVLLFEVAISKFFPYRNWVLGVRRVESVVAKIEDSFILRQIDKSENNVINDDAMISDYTKSLKKKWARLRESVIDQIKVE